MFIRANAEKTINKCPTIKWYKNCGRKEPRVNRKGECEGYYTEDNELDMRCSRCSANEYYQFD